MIPLSPPRLPCTRPSSPDPLCVCVCDVRVVARCTAKTHPPTSHLPVAIVWRRQVPMLVQQPPHARSTFSCAILRTPRPPYLLPAPSPPASVSLLCSCDVCVSSDLPLSSLAFCAAPKCHPHTPRSEVARWAWEVANGIYSMPRGHVSVWACLPCPTLLRTPISTCHSHRRV